MTAKPGCHLAGRTRMRSACGINNPQRCSTNPAVVTCDRCKETQQMFDAVVRAHQVRKRVQYWTRERQT